VQDSARTKVDTVGDLTTSKERNDAADLCCCDREKNRRRARSPVCGLACAGAGADRLRWRRRRAAHATHHAGLCDNTEVSGLPLADALTRIQGLGECLVIETAPGEGRTRTLLVLLHGDVSAGAAAPVGG
jgi:hypothetical protein